MKANQLLELIDDDNDSTINIGDQFYNPKAPHLGVRIATEQTLKNITFAKAINYGTCYYVKVK